MSDIKTQPPSMFRVDTSRAAQYLYAEKPTLNFGQKLLRGVGKAFAFLGPIGATVLSFVPGAGPAAALGLYGASRIAGDLTNNALANDAAKMQEFNSEMSQKTITTPGLFEQQSDADATTDFMISDNFAPSQFDQAIGEVAVNRMGSVSGAFSNYLNS